MRGALYELFHYLNHTVLFGVSHLGFFWRLTEKITKRSYESSARQKMSILLRYVVDDERISIL